MTILRPHRRALATGVGVLALASILIDAEVRRTAPVREATRTLSDLIALANRQDVAGASRLCTDRFLSDHPLRESPEGGLVGLALPRSIHPNYRTWRRGESVWICPTRPGPASTVYRLIPTPSGWRFDGLVEPSTD